MVIPVHCLASPSLPLDLNGNTSPLLSLTLSVLSLVDLNANASQLVRYSTFNDDCLALSIAYPDDANAAAYSLLSR